MNQSDPIRVAVVGATGAIGQRLLPRLAQQDGLHGHALARTTPPHAPVPVQAVDFADDAALAQAIACDVLLCALGTTQAKSGKAGLRAVDHDLVLRCLRAAHGAGARRAVVVSALGASRRAGNVYSRTKGDMEHAAAQIGYEALHLLRPSLLLGPRAELRPAEAVGKALAPAINWALPPVWRAIDADDVAAAMVDLAGREDRGVWVHHLPLASSRSRQVKL